MVISATDQEAIIKGFMPSEDIIALLKRVVPPGCGDPVAFGEVYRLLLAWTQYRFRLGFAEVENETLTRALSDFKSVAGRGHPRYGHKAEALLEVVSAL